MAEEKFDQQPVSPLSEQDITPITPLSPKKILDIAQIYTESFVLYQTIGRRMDENPAGVDADEVETMHYQSGHNDAIRKVLRILGQDNLVSIMDERLRQLFNLP